VAVPNSPNSFLYLVWLSAYSVLETICKGCKMSEPIRYESAERVRDFYREQGAVKERERIIKLLEDQIRESDLPVDKCIPHYHPIIGKCCCKLIALITGRN